LKKDHDIALRGHHLLLLYGAFGFWRRIILRLDMLRDGYGIRHVIYTINVLKKITKFDIRVKMVDNLDDDICKICRKRNSECTKDAAGEIEAVMIQGLGFKVGKIYSSKYLCKKIREGDITERLINYISKHYKAEG